MSKWSSEMLWTLNLIGEAMVPDSRRALPGPVKPAVSLGGIGGPFRAGFGIGAEDAGPATGGRSVRSL